MISYFIFLRNEFGQQGYLFALQDPDAGIRVCDDISGAARFDNEDDAEKHLYSLEEKYHLNREEAGIQQHAVDDVITLQVGKAPAIDSISVVREGESRYITVHNMGFEASEELPDEVADLLVRVLWKLQLALGTR